MNSWYKILLRSILVVSLFAVHLHAFATEQPLVQVLDGSKGGLQVDSFRVVQDNNYTNLSMMDTPYSVKNIVTLRINEFSNLYLRDSFTVNVKVRITYYYGDGFLDSGFVDKVLTVRYDSLGKYQSISNFVFSGAHKVKVSILSVVSSVTWDVLPLLQLQNEMDLYPDYKFSCTNDVIDTVNYSTDSIATQGELYVSWKNIVAADQYDLEWTYLDSSSLDGGVYNRADGSLDQDKIFANNATRVSVTGTSYMIPLMYDDTGSVFFRVRPVQLKPGNKVITADWSSDVAPATGLGRFNYGGHERKLNWQSTISFAEEGKRKIVVQYYDGSLRNRQTVTKDNTTNTTIVAENLYDFQGRPVIQVLPAPTLNSIIGYTHNFNRGLNGSEYEKSLYDTLLSADDYCTTGAPAMSDSSGASNYYSPLNPQKNTGFNKFIPDAKGYVFTETQYTQDNTGRITKQGGVGEDHRIGSGHETKYYYGSPTQADLDALFGTEVGLVSHYFKNMVCDANGQFSVSYVDMHGRTVATALAGAAPLDMQALNSNIIDTITEKLIDPSSNVSNGLSMQSQKSLLVSTAGLNIFHYDLTPESLRHPACNTADTVCYDCLYNLDITITDDCNNQKIGGHAVHITRSNFSIGSIDTTCSNPAAGFVVDTTMFLVPGNYEITKTLTVSRYGKDYYRDSVFLLKNLCTSLQQFIQRQQNIFVSLHPDCTPSCALCTDALGDFESFRNRYMDSAGIDPADSAEYGGDALNAYDSVLANCAILCQTYTLDDAMKKDMLLDMTPPSGQYADVHKGTTDVHSIFYYISNGSASTVPEFKSPDIVYLNSSGLPDSVFDDRTQELVIPQELDSAQFVQKFQSSWAEALLTFHPENCKLNVYEAHKPANLWAQRFEDIDSYADAVAGGWFNPIDGLPGATSNIDPLSTEFKPGSTTTTYYNDLKNDLNKYFPYSDIHGATYLSLWSMACMMTECGPIVTGDHDTTCLHKWRLHPFDTDSMCSGDLDMAWRTFREMYIQTRNNIIYTIVNSAPCNSSPTATAIYAFGHTPNFVNATDGMSKSGLGNLTVSTVSSQPAQEKQIKDSIASYESQTCESYVTEWMQQLSPCNYTTLQFDTIKNLLLGVCEKGSDITHVMGASSISPDSSNEYSSFEEVLKAFNDAHGIADGFTCNPYLITVPAPYDKQPAYYDETIYTKPSDCECSVIKGLYGQYQAYKKTYASFSAYVNHARNVSMADSTLYLLMAECDSSMATCKYLARPVSLPAALQCNKGSVCATCSNVDTLYNKYLKEYGASYIPTYPVDDTDTVHTGINNLFLHFMNTGLGFNEDLVSYLNFLDTCKINITSGSTGGGTGGTGVSLNLKVFLGGAYVAGSGLMKDSLRSKQLIPLTDPYFTEPFLEKNYTPVGSAVSTISPSILQTTGNNAIVDWVWVQLQSGINNCTTIATKSGLVERNGTVVGTDGNPLSFPNIPAGNYYIIVRHRNHLGVMTAQPITLTTASIASVDFTNPATATWGTNAQQTIGSITALWPGDINADHKIDYDSTNGDRGVLIQDIGGSFINVLPNTYNNADINFDGIAKYSGPNNDQAALLNVVLGGDKTKVINEQLPSCIYSTSGISLKLKVFLGGAYDATSGVMQDSLRSKQLIPLTDPYFTEPLLEGNYKPVGSSVSTINASMLQEISNNQIVDWVWVQLQSGTDSCTTVATQSGLVERDGTVMGTDGNPLSFPNVPAGNYYIIVRHRNHLGVMTAQPISLGVSSPASVDFTNPSTATWGTNAQQTIGSITALWPGDINADHKIDAATDNPNSDYSALLNALGGTSSSVLVGVYNNADVNFDSRVRMTSAIASNDYLQLVHTLGGSSNTISEQLPTCTYPSVCDQFASLITNYQNTYIYPASGYVDLDMRTFAGNKTPDEGPKGVFDINKILIGNTVSGTLAQIDSSYVQIWNSSSVNHAVGTLNALPDGQFRLYLNAGKSAPVAGVIGMRYCQFDIDTSFLGEPVVGSGCYMDFGDSNKINIDSAYNTDPNPYDLKGGTFIDGSPFAVGDTYGGNVDSAINRGYYIDHFYNTSQPRTITIYHPDVQGIFFFNAVGDNGGTFSNLRGYMPQQTLLLKFEDTKDSVFNLSNIANFNEVNSILSVDMATVPSYSETYQLPNSYFTSFANNANLKTINFTNSLLDTNTFTSEYIYPQFNKLFPGLNNNFTQLVGVNISDQTKGNFIANQYNPSAINFSLPKLVDLNITGYIKPNQIDSIIIQASRSTQDSGILIIKSVDNSTRTAASNTAYNSLISRKWFVGLGNPFFYQKNIPNRWALVEPLRDSIPLTDAFTDYYNQQQGTGYTYHQLQNLHLATCGTSIDPNALSSCDSLKNTLSNFRDFYNTIDFSQVYQNRVITKCANTLVDAENALLKASYDSVIDYGKSLPKGYVEVPWSNDFNAKMRSVSPNASSYPGVFNVIVPFSMDCSLVNNDSGRYYIDQRKKAILDSQVVVDTDFVIPSLATSADLTSQYFAPALYIGDNGFALIYGVKNGQNGSGIIGSEYSYYQVSIPENKFLFSTAFNFAHDTYGVEMVPLNKSVNTPSAYDAYYDLYYLKHAPYVNVDSVTRIYDLRYAPNIISAGFGNIHNNYSFKGLEVTFDRKDGSTDSAYLYNINDDYFIRAQDEIDTNLYNQDCRRSFTTYFNMQHNSNYTFHQIDSVYYATCGIHPDMPCSETGSTPTDTAEAGPLLCGNSQTIFPVVPLPVVNDCTDSTNFSVTSGTDMYDAYTDSLKNTFDSLYRDKCLNAYKYENFTVRHVIQEYHYTLYHYDQAGNLVKTTPPKGVVVNRSDDWVQRVDEHRLLQDSELVPSNTLYTQYRYNTLNQVIAQLSPDGGESHFWYDRLGRLCISQNAKQLPNNQYSYTLYDSIGRITEVGQIASTKPMDDSISRLEDRLTVWINTAADSREQITQTAYDDVYAPVQGAELTAQNVRNRVAYTSFYNTAADLYPGGQASATYYSYDIEGNVDTLVQDYNNGVMKDKNRFKKMAYNYDLISGKVNQVAYQPGQADAFYHRYLYDAENRITNVLTSHDSINWDNEAFYQYYKHGPLARTVIGQQEVQGIDYAYTLQGWLKAINPGTDSDGIYGTPVAKDEYSLALDYNDTDYTAIGDNVPWLLSMHPSTAGALGDDYRPLFNGNISSMAVNIAKLNQPLLYNYEYDQLNRLVAMDAWKSNDLWSSLEKVNDFKERVSYDPNGNILSYLRNGNNTFAGLPLSMDSLTYNYKPATNQLSSVNDAVADGNYKTDIDNEASDNYTYDAIGNMTKDVKEGIDAITWTVYGKIDSIHKTNGTTIKYAYDASGNRISKVVTTSSSVVKTCYVRDASGNTMSVYTAADTANSGHLMEKEVDIYGSSRLGLWTPNIDMTIADAGSKIYLANLADSGYCTNFDRGLKQYELTNHLGNVLVTISDKKKLVLATTTGDDNGNCEAGTGLDILNVNTVGDQSSYTARLEVNMLDGFGRTNDADTYTIEIDPALTSCVQPDEIPAGSYYAADVITAQDYYPFGMLQPGRQYNNPSAADTSYRYGFNGQQKSTEIDPSGNLDDAMYWEYDSRIGLRWNRDVSIKNWESPYSVLSDDPIWMVDFLGDDWFKYKADGDKESGYHWQDGSTYQHKTGVGADGKDVFETLTGYKAVVVFSGSRDEKLGTKKVGKIVLKDNLFGEGAVLATVTVYGPKGADDIQQYKGLSMTSDFKSFGAIADGEYSVNYRDPGKTGKLKSHWAVNNTGAVDCLDGINPSPLHPYSSTQKSGVYLHTSNRNGFAGKIYDKKGKLINAITTGCLLIVPTQYDKKGAVISIGWDEFNKQLSGVTQFHLDLTGRK